QSLPQSNAYLPNGSSVRTRSSPKRLRVVALPPAPLPPLYRPVGLDRATSEAPPGGCRSRAPAESARCADLGRAAPVLRALPAPDSSGHGHDGPPPALPPSPAAPGHTPAPSPAPRRPAPGRRHPLRASFVRLSRPLAA